MSPIPALRRVASPLAASSKGAVGAGVFLLCLVVVSLFLRTKALDGGYWIDEGLSIGIASQPFSEIPEVLLQDGSPPLYYLLLHGWMKLFGSAETATHTLSLVFALLTIPVALWAGWTLFDRRTGWVCASLAAVNSFLTLYAQETRMYALVGLLALIATTAFVHAFVRGRRRHLITLVVALALLLYTHNWAFFLCAGLGVAFLVLLHQQRDERRRLLRDGLITFAVVGLVFAPWGPSLVFQVLNTGAPWAEAPSVNELLGAVGRVLGGPAAAVALLLGGGAGLAAVLRRPPGEKRTALLTVLVAGLATLVSAWLFSQVSPAWAYRYMAIALGPLLLLAGVGVAHAGRLGLVTLGLIVLFAASAGPPSAKSNVWSVTNEVEGRLGKGDVVISTHPEQTPVLFHYLPGGLRYYTPMGPVPDPQVMDWRGALPRLTASRTSRNLRPILDTLPVGKRVLLVRPIVGQGAGWSSPWTRVVRARSSRWHRTIAADPRFERATMEPRNLLARPKGVRALVYKKTRSR